MSDATFAVFRSVDDLLNQMDDNEKVKDDGQAGLFYFNLKLSF